MSISSTIRIRRCAAAVGALALLPVGVGAATASTSTVSPSSVTYVNSEDNGVGQPVVEPTGNVWETYYQGSAVPAGLMDRSAAGSLASPLSDAWAIGFDAKGYGYALGSAGVKVYAPGVLDRQANPKPVRVVSGSATLLGSPDSLHGSVLGVTDPLHVARIVVAPNGSFMVSEDGWADAQLVFPAGASGNAKPRKYSFGTLAAGAVASAGGASSLAQCDGRGGAAVFSWSASGVIKPSRAIHGADPSHRSCAVAMDNFGDVYSAAADGVVNVFGPRAKGDAAPISIISVKPTSQALTGYGSETVPGVGRSFDYLAVGRDRAVYGEVLGSDNTMGMEPSYWLEKLPALVSKAAATVKVESLSAPTSTASRTITVG